MYGPARLPLLVAGWQVLEGFGVPGAALASGDQAALELAEHRHARVRTKNDSFQPVMVLAVKNPS